MIRALQRRLYFRDGRRLHMFTTDKLAEFGGRLVGCKRTDKPADERIRAIVTVFVRRVRRKF